MDIDFTTEGGQETQNFNLPRFIPPRPVSREVLAEQRDRKAKLGLFIELFIFAPFHIVVLSQYVHFRSVIRVNIIHCAPEINQGYVFIMTLHIILLLRELV
jgi:hypothetical protein